MTLDEISNDVDDWIRTNYPASFDLLLRLGHQLFLPTDGSVQGKSPDDPFFLPSDEILTFKTSGKLVRGDVAIMAIHMFVARVYFRSLAHTTSLKVAKFKDNVNGILGVFVGSKFLAKDVAKKLLSIANALANLFEAIQGQRDFEAAIRRASLVTQRELNKRCLGGERPKRNRKRRFVWSRHSPKK